MALLYPSPLNQSSCVYGASAMRQALPNLMSFIVFGRVGRVWLIADFPLIPVNSKAKFTLAPPQRTYPWALKVCWWSRLWVKHRVCGECCLHTCSFGR